MTLWAGLFSGVGVALVGGLVTWLVARQSKSGTVRTTEAETLWAQAQEMRSELKLQVANCEKRCEQVELENTRLREGLIHAEEKILNQRTEILHLREHVVQLQEDLQVTLRSVRTQASSTKGDVDALRHEMSLIQGGNNGN